MSIRERDAADNTGMAAYRSNYSVARDAIEDRRTLLAALDALVEAAGALERRGFLDLVSHTSEEGEMAVDALRAAIASAKEASDG